MSTKINPVRNYALIGGLAFFYAIQFFGNKPMIFISYFLVSALFYFLGNNIQKSATFGLILAIFSETGIGISMFKMEPIEFNPDSGWWFSPMTLMAILLITVSKWKNQAFQKYLLADLLIVLFFIWNSIVLYFYPHSENVLYAVLNIFEICLVYFLLRINLEKGDIKMIFRLILSILVFQTVLGLLQYAFGSNIGVGIESANEIYRYGLTAAENEELFRITGTFGHANLLAVSLITMLPIVLLRLRNNFLIIGIFISAILLTLSRVAWITVILQLIYSGIYFLKSKKNGLNPIIKLFLSLMLAISLLFPVIISRTYTLNDAFAEGGSWDSRNKIWQKAIDLFQQFTVTGTGHNRFVQSAFGNEQKSSLNTVELSYASKIHNLFLEIATETGIFGLYLFVLFIFYQYGFLYSRLSFTNINHEYYNILLLSLSGLIFMSLFNPIFLTTLFRLYFLLPALIFI